MLPGTLSLLDLRGSVATYDAIGCQRDTVEKIIAGGGDFCIPTKGNQKDLVSGAALMVDCDIADGKAKCHSTLDVDRRIEHRTYYISHLDEGESLPDWPHAKAVCKVHRLGQTLADNKYVTSEDMTYFICSRHFSELEFEQAVRGHWSVESFHYIQDKVFREDRSRARRGNVVANTAVLNRLAYNILSIERKRWPDEPTAWEERIFHFIVNHNRIF